MSFQITVWSPITPGSGDTEESKNRVQEDIESIRSPVKRGLEHLFRIAKNRIEISLVAIIPDDSCTELS
jgi:phosphate uptake regulator